VQKGGIRGSLICWGMKGLRQPSQKKCLLKGKLPSLKDIERGRQPLPGGKGSSPKTEEVIHVEIRRKERTFV